MINTKKVKELLARFDTPSDLPQAGPQPAAIGDAEINALEDRIGTRVPDDLRDWLKISNGAFVGTVPLYGVHPPGFPLRMEKILEIYPLWREKKWIPISSDGCGNYYLMATQGEFGQGHPIFFVEAVTDETAPRYIVASDLGHFLVLVMESELAQRDLDAVETELEPSPWFNEQKVLHDDPAILNFHGVPLPWNADKSA
jgi:cell wall assembly regulator SMI1